MIGTAAIAARRPWLAATALAVAIGGMLLPTPAVPLTKADAALPAGPDDRAIAADQLTVQAVLRVTEGTADRPLLPNRRMRAGAMTTA